MNKNIKLSESMLNSVEYLFGTIENRSLELKKKKEIYDSKKLEYSNEGLFDFFTKIK